MAHSRLGGLRAIGLADRLIRAVLCGDYAHEADFSSYKTYAWYETDTSLALEAPLDHEDAVHAVDWELAAKGLTKVFSDPDVYVTQHSDTVSDNPQKDAEKIRAAVREMFKTLPADG